MGCTSDGVGGVIAKPHTEPEDSECSTCTSPRSQPGVPPDSEDLKYHVQNTFIHIKDTCAEQTRMAQSMPHGMYLRCLDDEARAHKRAELAAQHAAPQFSPSNELQRFAP